MTFVACTSEAGDLHECQECPRCSNQMPELASCTLCETHGYVEQKLTYSQNLAVLAFRRRITANGTGVLVVDSETPWVYGVSRYNRDFVLSDIEHVCCPLCGSRNVEFTTTAHEPVCDECGLGYVSREEAV